MLFFASSPLGLRWLAAACLLCSLTLHVGMAQSPAQGDANAVIALEEVILENLSHGGPAKKMQLPIYENRDERTLLELQTTAQFVISAIPSNARWALYTHNLQDGGTLVINGIEIGRVTTNTEDYMVRNTRPFLFDVPIGLLREGTNTLVRRWAVRENLITSSRMMIGPKALVEPKYRLHYFLQNTMAVVSSVIAATIALILLGIFWQDKNSKQYLRAGISALGFGLLCITYFLPPMPTGFYPYWRLTIHAGSAAFIIGGWLYLLHDVGKVNARYRQFCWIWSATFLVASITRYWITGLTIWPVVTPLWHFVLAALGLYPVTALAISTWRYRRPRHLVYCAFALLGIAAGTHDTMIVAGTPLLPTQLYVLQTVVPIWFIIICFILITDFSKSLSLQRDQQAKLTEQLQAQKIELARLHASEQRAKLMQATAKERARIMQDMHDGLGSQLVSSLAMAQGGELSATQTYDLLRSCIDDLRLAIDTSNDSRDSLALALGNLRFRMAPRLQAAGITLQWDTALLQEHLPLPVDQKLPLLRIIQETISNTLKHAHASTLSIRVASTDQLLTIDIQDNGQGFDIDKAKEEARGKGLNSLSKRARILKSKLSLTSHPGQGTRILIETPLPAAHGSTG
jgi:signal transduction histidine kinase